MTKNNANINLKDDIYKAILIVFIFRKLNWHHASLVYSNTDYGIGGRNELKKRSAKFGVCFFDKEIPLPSSDEKEVFVNATRILKNAKSKGYFVMGLYILF